MQTRTLGAGGLEVSAIGLGCMGMSSATARPIRTGSSMIAFLRSAVERGVTFFDTAEAYGPFHNEALVGEALEPFRGQVVIATKFGFDTGRRDGGRWVPWTVGPSTSSEVAEASLRAAQGRCDRPLLPAPGRPRACRSRTWPGRSGPDRGRARSPLRPVRAGRETIRRAHAVQPVTAVQSEYSLWTRGPERGGAADARGARDRLRPVQPARQRVPDRRDRRIRHVRRAPISAPSSPGSRPTRCRPTSAWSTCCGEIGGRKGATPAQVALAWLLAQRPWIVPIPGTRRSERLDENLAAAAVALTPDDLREIDEAASRIDVRGARYPDDLEALTGR